MIISNILTFMSRDFQPSCHCIPSWNSLRVDWLIWSYASNQQCSFHWEILPFRGLTGRNRWLMKNTITFSQRWTPGLRMSAGFDDAFTCSTSTHLQTNWHHIKQIFDMTVCDVHKDDGQSQVIIIINKMLCPEPVSSHCWAQASPPV